MFLQKSQKWEMKMKDEKIKTKMSGADFSRISMNRNRLTMEVSGITMDREAFTLNKNPSDICIKNEMRISRV